jgi:hypothetical protein
MEPTRNKSLLASVFQGDSDGVEQSIYFKQLSRIRIDAPNIERNYP